jgi:hypothetical protein
VLVVGAAALITISAGAARAKTLHFKVVSANVSATLTFQILEPRHDQTTDGSIVLTATPKGKGVGSIPGKVTFGLKGDLSETVTIHHEVSSTSPYEETCANKGAVTGRGGLTLKRTGSKVLVRWAFPQAAPSFCHGPDPVSTLTTKMKRVYSAKALSGKKVTIVLNGSATAQGEPSEPGQTVNLTYRWHAVVKLARK